MTPGSQASASLPPKNLELVVVFNPIGKDKSSLTLQSCKMMSWRDEEVAIGRAYIQNGPHR